jgi:hypothetical protein
MAQRTVNNNFARKNGKLKFMRIHDKTKTVPKMESQFDAQGSYTGVDCFDKYEKPVQDADDL